MELVRGFQKLTHILSHPVVTIGNFDGVHIGHRKIIELAISKAKARGGQCVAYTFRPHPQIALRPGAQIQLLSTYDEKIELLESLGLDVIVEEPFSREFSVIEPERFFNEVLLQRLRAEVIVVGYDFAFGKERNGHLEALESFCKSAKVELVVVPPQSMGISDRNEIVSSSRIRNHLLSGKIELATRLLGKEFFYRGVVMKGAGRGRKIGFPTANLKIESKLTLPYGVYATWAVRGSQKYPSVTNIGVRPTFQAEDKELSVLVETHLLNETMDLYGSTLEVRFVAKLREERKFSGIEELKAQIYLDASQAEGLLKN
jgi:riboflavin kinase/FMN adenylyltransferase